MKPIVAVVGRPNVGKSTLVNRLAQTSDAIVHESRGVTRDRSYHTADWNGREFTIVDTGGIEPLKSDDVFATSIRDQALAAAEEAAVILFVVDGRTGVTEEDESVARMLKRCDKPVFLLVNKLDNPDRENDSIWEFYSLGIGEPTPLSALHGHGTGDLLDDIVALLPEEEDEVADEFPDALNVAIIGRPNAGKSSLFNRILAPTVLSCPTLPARRATPSTLSSSVTASTTAWSTPRAFARRAPCTRTSSTTPWSAACAPSTAPTWRCSSSTPPWALPSRTRRSWVLPSSAAAPSLCCSTSGICSTTTVSARPAWRPSTAVWASWLLAQYLRISALTGRSVEKIWAMVDAAEKTRSQKISTSRLNAFLTDLREFGHTVVDGKRRLRMHYVTQTGVNPPTFTFFVNHSDLVNDTYQRYVENRMRSTFDFAGTPIRLFFRKKEQKDA